MAKPIAMVLAGLCLLLAPGAQADPLTGGHVSRFIAAMEAMMADQALAEQLMSAWTGDSEVGSRPGPLLLSETARLLQKEGDTGRVEAIIRTHGFDDPSAWARIGDRALLALMKLELGENGLAIQERLAAITQGVSTNQYFSDGQKQRLRQMTADTEQLLERVARVPQSDLKAVRPHRDQLIQLLDYQQLR